jgi:hypothetical protein
MNPCFHFNNGDDYFRKDRERRAAMKELILCVAAFAVLFGIICGLSYFLSRPIPIQ